MLVTRKQIADKYKTTPERLNARIQKSWQDFPIAEKTTGRTLLYNEAVIDKYMEKKEQEATSDFVLRKIQKQAGYFGNQKFLSIKGVY